MNVSTLAPAAPQSVGRLYNQYQAPAATGARYRL